MRDRSNVFHENRAVIGARIKTPWGPALDLAYMLRSRIEPDATEHDHILLLSLVTVSELPRARTMDNSHD